MTKSPCLIAAITLLLPLLPSPTSAQSIDENFYYKLSTQFRGDGMKLDVFNGDPKNNLTRLDSDQDVSGQFWRFVGERGWHISIVDVVPRPGHVPGHF